VVEKDSSQFLEEKHLSTQSLAAGAEPEAVVKAGDALTVPVEHTRPPVSTGRAFAFFACG
jgi:hypothetical protein